ncbi:MULTISPECIES: hypothetical protein [unclassified Cedecea]
MKLAIAGGFAVGAYHPTESELSRRFKQIIKAARKQLEALCNSI